jgi:hypothetical protein
VSARAYPGRDMARLMRRARSIQRQHAAPTNERARCCAQPSHVTLSLPDRPLVTGCRNCGAVI